MKSISLRIPYIKRIPQRRIKIHILKQLIALVYDLIVIVKVIEKLKD